MYIKVDYVKQDRYKRLLGKYLMIDNKLVMSADGFTCHKAYIDDDYILLRADKNTRITTISLVEDTNV